MDTTPENYRKPMAPRKPRAIPVRPIRQAQHARDGECPDGGWHPLTRHQKARLCMLARDAYAHLKVYGISLEEWRQETAIRACGRRISEACQVHWADLKAAFVNLGGKPDVALRVLLREGDNKRRVAMHKLAGELARKGLDESYAAKICRAQFKVALADATAKQIWCLFFTIKNRKSR